MKQLKLKFEKEPMRTQDIDWVKMNNEMIGKMVEINRTARYKNIYNRNVDFL